MVEVVRPEFVPDPSLDREAMETLQHEVADAAVFEDGLSFDPGAVATDRQATLEEAGGGEAHADDTAEQPPTAEPPVIAGVDQAFRDQGGEDPRAVSAVVATRDGEVIERVSAEEPLEIPYIPGLLSFREGGSILAALAALSVEPDVLLLDGSGRIHFREAGIATHVGVTVDVPAVGVAKSLLCGEPERDVDDLAAGEVVPIRANADVSAPEGTVIGAAVQSRQFDSPNRRINPLYVSPGHRVGWETAADLALATTAGYKLPEPVREADRWVGALCASE